jgi:flavin reductase (DIM6/NTAB) family NADH-FMN oxidoreductase RutF
MVKGKVDEVLKKLPLGVSVVTVGRGGVENGLTVSWAMPVSFSPMHVAIAIDAQHYSNEFLKSTKSFVLNVLEKGQTQLAAQFAKQSFSDKGKLAGVETREGESGSPILTAALCYFDCEVVGHHAYGDHILYVGKVVDAAILNDGAPMLSVEGMRYQKKSK